MTATIPPGLSQLYYATEYHRGDPLADDMGAEPKGYVHDWRNHLPDKLAEIWYTLSPETRMAVFLVCEQKASNEEWD